MSPFVNAQLLCNIVLGSSASGLGIGQQCASNAWCIECSRQIYVAESVDDGPPRPMY